MPQIDLGQVVGPQGAQGEPGPQGAQGIQGPAGPAATINGVNALIIEAGNNIELSQSGSTTTLSVPTDAAPTEDSTKPVQSGGVAAALSNKAPAGYGLGANASSIPGNDLNNAILGGFYVFSSAVQNIPSFMSGKVLVMPYKSLQYYTQIAFAALTSEIAFRFCNNGVWGPWEYLNPLLSPGIEYRTVERYNGKPVYTKAVSLGTVSGGGTKSVEHGVTDLEACIECNGFAGYQNLVGNKYVNSITVGASVIELVTDSNFPSQAVVAIMKYTKTTD